MVFNTIKEVVNLIVLIFWICSIYFHELEYLVESALDANYSEIQT